MVSKLSVGIIVFDMLFGIAVPLGTMLFLKRRKRAQCVCFWVGAAVIALFALVLEQAAHSIVLRYTQIVQNVFLYALYGGIMAGLFEETGRFAAMRFVLKKRHGNRANALMYGAGHGGLEMVLVLTLGMVNNLLYAVMLNAGRAEELLAPLNESNRAVLESAFATLINASPATFLLSPMERIGAFAVQMALSAIVWTGAAERRHGMWLLAFALHAGIDFVSALLAGLGVATFAIECAIWVMAAGIVMIAIRIWRKQYGFTQ